MANFIGKALLLPGAAAAASLVYWTEKNTTYIPINNKGNLFTRMGNIVVAYLNKPLLKDEYTAEMHTRTVANLSSEDVLDTQKLNSELLMIKHSKRGGGYLYRALHRTSHLLSVPVIDARSSSDYLYGGELCDQFDEKARDDILQGNYIRCHKLKKGQDVIISGTKKQAACEFLEKAMLRSAAMIASRGRFKYETNEILEDVVLADSPVFDLSETGWVEAGTLADMPVSVQERIYWNNFTACSYFRTHNGRNQSAFFVGMRRNEDEVCNGAYFKHVQEMVMENKRREREKPQEEIKPKSKKSKEISELPLMTLIRWLDGR